MSSTDIRQISRSVHLDFHTSQFIEDVGVGFDAKTFAARLKKAHVNSINIFSKCHHGMFYYPTQVGKMHPSLDGRDLLGEMIEALHAEEIRCPIYTTVCWEEHVAYEHPDWRDMRKDGTYADLRLSADMVTKQPAPWKFLNFLHPEYITYFKAHLKELMDAYDCDGFWIDIVFLEEEGGWSPEFVKRREQWGLMDDTPENKLILEWRAQEEFAREISAYIRKHKPEASIFYNTPNYRFSEGDKGMFPKSEHQTEIDIESLPSGFWGYHHFPRAARHIMSKQRPFLGMTGKFQKMWGDFGGIKPFEALEYECFKAQAMGGGISVGDQMHPRGVLDEDTYDLIGHVFEQVAAAEGFYADSTPVAEIGVVCPNHPSLPEGETGLSEEGVVQILEELHYDFVIIDDTSDLSSFKLLILPDSVVISEGLKAKIVAFESRGGRLIISYGSGFDRAGKWQLPFFSSKIAGKTALYPTYWKVNNQMVGNKIQNERVVYQAGMNVSPAANAQVLVHRILPYFNRTDLTYMSHFHAPPQQEDLKHPAVIEEGNTVYFADKVFHEYRQKGSQFIKQVMGQVLNRLVGNPMVGAGLPSSILVYPRRKDTSLLITLLRYLPVKKAVESDVIDEALNFYGEQLVVNASQPVVVKNALTGEPLAKTEDGYKLPDQKGRLLLEVEGYYQ